MIGGLLVYLALIAATSFLGGLIPLVRDWSRRSLLVPMAFAAGILLGAAFFHMIPESTVLMGRDAGWPTLAGFLVIYCLERFILIHPNPQGAEAHGMAHHIHVGLTAFIGLSFHSLLDGLALASAYQRPDLGGVVLLAVMFHKMPDAFALSTLLLLDRWQTRTLLLLMLLFSLTTPVGALVTWLFIHQAGNTVVASALALSAGTFLAVATSDVLPQIRRYDDQRMWPLMALFVGLAFSWIGVLIG